MKKTIKAWNLLLAVCLILGLAACGQRGIVDKPGPYIDQTVTSDVAEVVINDKGQTEKISIKVPEWGKDQPKVLLDPKDVTLNFLMSKMGEDATGIQYEIYIGNGISYDYNNIVAVYDGPADTEPDISVTRDAYNAIIGLWAADGYEDLAVKSIWGGAGIPDVFVRDEAENGGVSILTEASQNTMLLDFDAAKATMTEHTDPFGLMSALFREPPKPVVTDKDVFDTYIGEKLDMSIYETRYEAANAISRDGVESQTTIKLTADNSYVAGNPVMLQSYERKWTCDISEDTFSAKAGLRYHYCAPTEEALDDAINQVLARLDMSGVEYRTKRTTSNGWEQTGSIKVFSDTPLNLAAANPVMAEVQRSQTGTDRYEADIYIAYENGPAK